MAVKPANSKYHTFTFNGVRAADYGIYVTDVNVFNSAARDVEYIEIPGRDGAFALDRGRFQNISVVYKCAMTQDTDEDFATAISEFRNAIASTKGYKRLEDDIHTDEYRMGVFSKGLEAPTLNTKTATFDVEFNCQPQRYLKSGEIPRTIGGSVVNTKTKSGAVVSIESDGADKVTSLVAQIEPVQAGSGDPSPTNVRPITGWTAANVFVTGKNLLDPTYRKNVNTSTTCNIRFYFYDGTYHGGLLVKKGVTYTLKISGSTKAAGLYINTVTNANKFLKYSATELTFTPEEDFLCSVDVYYATHFDVSTINCQLEVGATATEYEPYKGTTYPVSFGSAGTVYGGTVDVVTGVLTVTHKIFAIYADWDWVKSSSFPGGFFARTLSAMGFKANTPVICSHAKTAKTISEYVQGTCYVDGSLNIRIMSADSTVDDWKNYIRSEQSAGREITVCGELATPQTYNLTAQDIELLTGQNNVWANTGDITLTYGDDPNKIVNPTLFESHPLLHLWGYGNIGINGEQLSINNDQYGNILLVDKTTHEATSLHTYIYHNSVSPNPKVSLLNEGDTLTLVRGSFIYIQLYGRPVVRFTNVSVSVGGGISASVPSGATQIKNILLTFPEYTFSFGTARAETIPITITAAYTYEGAQRTATVTGDIRVVSSFGSSYQAISIAIINITNTGSADFSVGTNPDKNGTLQAIYGYSTKRPFADDADFYFDLDIGEAYKIEDGHTISVNNAVTIPAKLPTLKSGVNTITYDDTITQFKIVPRWWEV